MLKFLSALAVSGLLMGAPCAQAQTGAPDPDAETPKELFEGATRMMMQALELLIKAVPQYAAPVMLDNGDILIRRKRDDAPPSDGDDPSSDQSRI